MLNVMDEFPTHPHGLNERMTLMWQRGVRLATRLAIGFGLAVVAAILLGAAVTDNGLVQLIVTILAALGLWIPFSVLVAKVDRLFTGRRSGTATAGPGISGHANDSWRRLSAIAPGHSRRLAVLRRSLERSRLALGSAHLDPGAHDLCVLIDRRLPELIDRELDTLPPDDRNRSRQLGDLIDLIEQFARHCSGQRSGDSADASFQAAVLRRRFEERLSRPELGTGD